MDLIELLGALFFILFVVVLLSLSSGRQDTCSASCMLSIIVPYFCFYTQNSNKMLFVVRNGLILGAGAAMQLQRHRNINPSETNS